jgi:PIN domain nuclease of toxin-antitoxin system
LNLLLDTHICIWSLLDQKRLPPAIQALLTSEDNIIFVSPVSILEISVKHRLGRPDSPIISGGRALAELVQGGCRVLDVTGDHAAMLDELPLLHGDPFDRLLVAQALVEHMRIVTKDAKVAAYNPSFITW